MMRAFLACAVIINTMPLINALRLRDRQKRNMLSSVSNLFLNTTENTGNSSVCSISNKSKVFSVKSALPPFHRLRLSNGVQVHIEVNPAIDYSIEMWAVKGCEQYVRAIVSANTLSISFDDEFMLEQVRLTKSLFESECCWRTC